MKGIWQKLKLGKNIHMSYFLQVNWAVHDVVYMELYNLADDPYENVNLATDPAYASDITALYEDVFKNGWSSYNTLSLDNTIEN